MALTRYPSYEDEKSAERPVRLDRTEGHVIIEGKTYPARELVEALVQSGYAELRAAGDSLVLGRKRISPIFKSSQERAMAALCHGSLAYCCPLNKRCAERDRALEILGLTARQYEELKGDSHIGFIDAAKGLSSREHHQERHYGRGRTANEPAVDRGFGSDDYRRDFDSLDRVLRTGRRSRDRETGQTRWSGEDVSRSRQKREGPYDDLRNPFTDVDMDGYLTDDRDSCNTEHRRADSCDCKTSERVEGLGALFSQGELSPFRDDEEEKERRNFCFSCGRTINPGLVVCPWCGATQ